MTNDLAVDLTALDKQALEKLDRRLRFIRDRVRGVIRGYHTGFYLHGAAGLGKSFNIIRQLEEESADFRVFNSRMTGKGLYRALEHARFAVHVLEDMERLTDDRDAQGVLRSAVWAQPGRDRVVTWNTAAGQSQFIFGGGIIMLANRPLADLPELRALASRIAVQRLDVTEAEMAAHIRRVASAGFERGKHKLDPEQSRTVAEFVIEKSKRLNCPLDLRIFDNACLEYLQWEHDYTDCHWQDLVENRIRQTVEHFRHDLTGQSRKQRLAAHREIVRDICQQTEDNQERYRLWRERTGRSQASFYRRKQEVDLGEFD
jgi:hypothetical protein